MKTFRQGTALAGLSLAVILALLGCSAPSTGSSGGGTAGDGSSGQTDGDDASTDTGDGQNDLELEQFAELPDTFPSDELPLIDGDIHIALDLGTGWSVQFAVDDFAASFTDAVDKLKTAGYEAKVEQLNDEAGLGVFENAKYRVQLTAGESPDIGPTVSYVVIIVE